MLRGLFRDRATAARDRVALDRVRDLARRLLAGPVPVELTVNEIVCRDPGCPGEETVVLVLQPGAKTKAVKISKPGAAVTEQDLRSALIEAGFEVAG